MPLLCRSVHHSKINQISCNSYFARVPYCLSCVRSHSVAGKGMNFIWIRPICSGRIALFTDFSGVDVA